MVDKKNLENRLNTKLFEKQGRNIFPTSQALSLAEDARKILAQVQVAESKITKDRPGGIFRLGATDSLAGTRLSIPISRLLKRYPEIDFELKVASSEEIAEGILQRRLDAGILITEGRDERFSQTSLFREKLVIIAEKGSAPIKAASDIVGKTILAFHSVVPRKLAILIARGIGTRPNGAIFFCIILISCDFVKLCLKWYLIEIVSTKLLTMRFGVQNIENQFWLVQSLQKPNG